MKTILRLLLVSLAVLVFAVLSGLMPVHIGLFSKPIAQNVREATGLDLELDGPVVLRLGPRAFLGASSVTLSTPSGESLLQLDEAKVGFSVLALVRSRIHLRSVDLFGLRVDYCRPLSQRPEGPVAPMSGPPTIIVDGLDVRRIDLVCDGESADLRVDRLAAAAPASRPVDIEVSASVAGNPVRLTATGGTLAQLLGREAFQFEATVATGQGSVYADGVLFWDVETPVVETRVKVDVADSRSLGNAFDLSIPDIGTVDVEAAVRGREGRLEITDLAGALGATRFTASGSVGKPDNRLHVELSAELQQLDLTPFMTTAPGANFAATDFTRIFDALRHFDADASLRIEEIIGLPLGARSVSIETTLAGGLLELTAANAAALDGQLAVRGKLDVGATCPSLDLVAELDSVALSDLHRAGWLDPVVKGEVASARAISRSCGTSLAGHIEQLSATVTASGGRIVVGDEWPVTVAAFNVALKPNEPISASASATVAGEPLEFEARTGALQGLSGSVTWPVSLLTKADGSELRVEGTMGIATPQLVFDVTARLSALRIGALHAWLGVASDAAESLSAKARLRLDASRFVADDIAINLDGTDLGGSLTWLHAATPDTLAVTLRSDFIDLDSLRRTIEETRPHTAGAGEPPGWRALPPIDLDLAFDAIRGGAVDVTDVSIRGRLRAGQVDNAQVSALVDDELSLRGQLDVDLRRLPATLVFDAEAGNADLGRLLRRLEVADDLAMRAETLLLTVESEGDSLRRVLQNLSINATISGFAWDVPHKRSHAQTKMRLETLALSMQPGQPLGASTSGIIDDVPVELWMQLPGLGTVLGDGAELPLRVVAAAGDDVVMIDLQLDRSAGDEIRGRVELSGQAFDRRDRDLDALVAPLADYGLRGKLLVSDSGLFLSELEAQLGSSKASGNVSLSGNGRQRMAVDIVSPRLQVADWAFLPGFVRTGPVKDMAVTSATDTGMSDSGWTERGPLLRLNDLVVRYQEQYDLDLRVAVDALYAGRDLVGGASMELYIDEDELRLQPVRIRLPGGGLDAQYGWRIDDGRMAGELKARAEALVYGGLLRLIDPASESRGVLYLDIDVRAVADHTSDVSEFELLLSNADGIIEIAAWPENFEAGVLDLWTANLVFALLPAPTDGKSARLNCVVARFEAEDGLLTSKNVLMDSTRTIIRGRGRIDLAQRELDLLVTPQAKREKFFSASTPVRVTGPLEDFQVGVEPAGFLGTLLKWYTSLIYVPFKWLTGQRFPADGTQTCFDAMDWELTPELEAYFLKRDFSSPPAVR